MNKQKKVIELTDVSKKQKLIDIIRTRSFKTGDFTLASGQKSTYYFDLKQTICHPEGGVTIADMILDIIKDNNFKVDAIGGMEIGALPITFHVQSYAMLKGMPINAFFVRKQVKDHGSKQLVEGICEPKSNVIIVEDVTTTGGSALKSIEAVQAERNCNILAVISILNRAAGADNLFADKKIPFFYLVNKADFGIND
jgi:orotate phosphoribosyltransferase